MHRQTFWCHSSYTRRGMEQAQVVLILFKTLGTTAVMCSFAPFAGRQIHGALFRKADLEALAVASQRDREMREKEDRRMALKRQKFEDSMVRVWPAMVRLCGVEGGRKQQSHTSVHVAGPG